MNEADTEREAAMDSLERLHAEIDEEAGACARLHAERMQCARGCSACCLDDLSATAIEAERIRRAHPELLGSGAPHAIGACAFLGAEGECRIYRERPSVCRTQGLPLRMMFENEHDEIEERRDICPLNREGGPDVDDLDESACWLVGPYELRIGRLDQAFAGEDAARVRLRDLFEASA